MGVANRIADSTIGRQVSVLRHAAHVANRVEADLRDLEAEILRRLQKIDLTKFQAVRLRRALAEVRGAAAEFAKTQAKAQLEDLTGVAEAATKAAARDINTAVRADLVSGGFNARTFVEAMDSLAVVGGNTLKEYWDAFPAQVTSDYAKVIRNGVATGQTMRQITAAAADVPNFSPLRRHLRTYVRTSVINVHNHARDIFYQENDDLIGGIQWLSTLDARTSNICKALDGLSWNMEYEPIGHSIAFPGNVAHPNCRSTQIPILKSFEELSKNKALGRKLDESLSKSTRASMDGQVAEDIDYEHWLASKGDKFAREVLGPGRFELWKDGKLSFKNLVDQNARPRLLSELRETAVPAPPPVDEITEQAAYTWRKKILTQWDNYSESFKNAMGEYASDPTGYDIFFNHPKGALDVVRQQNSLKLLKEGFATGGPSNKEDIVLWKDLTLGVRELKPGDTIKYTGFVSADVNVKEIQGDGALKIIGRKGDVRGLPVVHPAFNSTEVLFPPGQTLKVISSEHVRGLGTVVTAEFLPYSYDDIVSEIAKLNARATALKPPAPPRPPPGPPFVFPKAWDIDQEFVEGHDSAEAMRAIFTQFSSSHRRVAAGYGEAHTEYTGAGFRRINGALRGDPDYLGTEAEDWADRLSEAFSLAPETIGAVRVYRGLGSHYMTGVLEVGNVFETPGFLSTSTDFSQARVFAQLNTQNVGRNAQLGIAGTILEIRVPPGVRALPGTQGEQEIILNHNSRFRVISTRMIEIDAGDGERVKLEIFVLELIP